LKIEYHKKFLKDLSKIPSPIRGEIEEFVFEKLPKLKQFLKVAKSKR